MGCLASRDSFWPLLASFCTCTPFPSLLLFGWDATHTISSQCTRAELISAQQERSQVITHFSLRFWLTVMLLLCLWVLNSFKTMFGLQPEKGSSTRGGHVPNKSQGGGAASNSGSGARGNWSGGVGRNVNTMSNFAVNTNFSGCPGGACGGQ